MERKREKEINGEDAAGEEEEEEEAWGGGADSVLKLTAEGSSISIRYHSLFGSHDDLLLLEVDDELLPDVLHHRVVVRGQPDEEAVLCTPSATYAMKFVGTSNSVFLIPPGKSTPLIANDVMTDSNGNSIDTPDVVASVFKVAPGNIELVHAAPRLDKLNLLLTKRPYRLDEDLEDDLQYDRDLYTYKGLLEQIQASEEELRDGLKALSAVEIDGFLRIVDSKSMNLVLKVILNNSVLHEWPLNALEEDNVAVVMESDGFPQRIVLHCLETFGSRVEGNNLWSLDEKKVCLQFAKEALDGGKMKMESFMEKWMRSIPSVMHAELRMLEGEVLYEKIGVETWVRAFSVAALPSTPAERFAALFQERPKWEWKDLEPYIRDLRVPGLSLEGLLIKHTRRTQPSADVEPIFSAR
ncbi:sister chromatid cohesion protein DCC1 [Ananas comosus]|uniref:Sister chromatid cohesion protein DCC1 n=1 Tax=Ananas comosus TaxID=4615 RepID=A0A6P5EZD9_ANACO|nr:sister chromatid cohesion protein DCC1 [Ananas comosus]